MDALQSHGKEGADKLELFNKKARLQAQADSLRKELRESQLTSFKQEARRRQAVLRRLQHVDEQGAVLLKGRAACEVRPCTCCGCCSSSRSRRIHSSMPPAYSLGPRLPSPEHHHRIFMAHVGLRNVTP